MRRKCLAWKSGLAGAIAREKMTIFWLGEPRGVFRIEFLIFSQKNIKNPGSRPFRAILAPDSSSPHRNQSKLAHVSV